MSAVIKTATSDYRFDDRPIDWKPFGRRSGFVYKLLNVNVEKRIVDMMFKFEPNRECFYHRHLSATAALVLEGEHRIREPNDHGGHILTVRPAGTYSVSDGGDRHIEGGGETGATVFFSMRGETDHIYDILDDDLNVVREVSIQDFAQAFADW